MNEMKVCNDCKIEKSLDDFYKLGNKGGKRNNFLHICKPCSRKEVSSRGPQSRYKKRYNLTVDQVDEMLRAQNSLCGICNIEIHLGHDQIDDHRKKATACVDHDHQYGYIRGLLCDNCNKGLGNFRDSHFILNNAQHYLIAHESLYNEKQQQ